MILIKLLGFRFNISTIGKREQILLRMDPILEGIVFPGEQTGSHTCDSCCPLKIMAENRTIHSSYMLHVFMYMMKYCTYLLDIQIDCKATEERSSLLRCMLAGTKIC